VFNATFKNFSENIVFGGGDYYILSAFSMCSIYDKKAKQKSTQKQNNTNTK
jgi:hypothetical protein